MKFHFIFYADRKRRNDGKIEEKEKKRKGTFPQLLPYLFFKIYFFLCFSSVLFFFVLFFVVVLRGPILKEEKKR